MDGARINSRIQENIEAILCKGSLYYLQILVGSHEAWDASLSLASRHGSHSQPALLQLPDSRSGSTRGLSPLAEDAVHVIL